MARVPLAGTNWIPGQGVSKRINARVYGNDNGGRFENGELSMAATSPNAKAAISSIS
jgi:hypothetical protein